MNLPPLNRKEVLRYLGYHNQNPEEATAQQMEEAEQLLRNVTKYEGTYQIFQISSEKEGVQVENTTLLLSGNSVQTLLAESHRCVFMAVTLGHGVDQTLRQLQLTDMAKAFIFDASASNLIEECCNQLENNIKNSLEGEFLTDRFSPGYGDLPLSVQSSFCKILQTDKKIGVNLSPTHLMSPKKSITAVLGIAKTPQPMRIKGCGFCTLRNNCQYRKGGKTCGT